MENNPLYRLYVQLKDRVDVLSSQATVGGSNGGPDISDVILRIRNLENRPSVDGILHDLSTSVDLLKKENQELKLKLEALNKFENIEERLYNLEVVPKVSLEPLNERVSVLETNDYEKRISALETRVSTMEQYSNQIPDLNYRIGDIEKRPDLSERLDKLESTVANLNLKDEETPV